MLSSEQLRKLHAAGLSSEQIIAVSEIMEEQQELIEERKRKDRDRKRRSRYVSSDSHGTVTGQSRDIPAHPSPNGFPLDVSPIPPFLNPNPLPQPLKENPPKGGQKKNPFPIESLKVDHIADWLAQKRMEGKYIFHDEHFIVEYFINYCKSNGKGYKDYVAALRNAFEWRDCQPKREFTGKPSITRPPSNLDNALAGIYAAGNKIAHKQQFGGMEHNQGGYKASEPARDASGGAGEIEILAPSGKSG